MNEFSDPNKCQLEDVAAYLDGELSGKALDGFEVHLKSCDECVVELRTQRQLLCTLDVAFSESRSFELPHDFTRVVAARAESDLSGMRNKGERRRALELCAILALVSFALLGAASRALVFDPVRSFLRIAGSLIELVWQTVYEVATGTTVVIRVVIRAIVFAPYGLGLFLALAFVISISVLPFLIAKYHRTQIIE
jgi:Putative zinc-finger